jgi:hypothetical protein
MNESLHRLEGLIRLLPEKGAGEQTAPGDIRGLLEEALKEKEKIRNALLDSALSLTEDKALRVLVRCYQDGLIRLSDEVYKSQQAYFPSHAHLYDPLLSALDRLLVFLKEDFGAYTNPERKIPDARRVRAQAVLKEQWAKVCALLHREGDSPFLEQMGRWFAVLLEDRFTPFLNERQYIYHRVLMNEFLDKIPEEDGPGEPGTGPQPEPSHGSQPEPQSRPQPGPELQPGPETNPGVRPLPESYPLFTPLVESLVYMDFNHPSILRHIAGAWSRLLKSLEAPRDQVARIRHWQALLAKLPRQKSYALYPGKRSLRDQLEQWLGTQLECGLYRAEAPLTRPGAYGDTAAPVPLSIISEAYQRYGEGVAAAIKVSKVQLSVSVPILALLIRLLVEHKIIVGMAQTEVIQFFALHFSTVRQPDISTGSMYGSYHKPLHPTVLMLRQCLKEWDRIAARWE